MQEGITTISKSSKRRTMQDGSLSLTKMIVKKWENGKKKNGKAAYISKTFHVKA